jgi:hypothetical protein
MTELKLNRYGDGMALNTSAELVSLEMKRSFQQQEFH